MREHVILGYPDGAGASEPDDLADRVDEVLRKISAQGKDALTEAERGILIRASAQYRGRNSETR